MYELNSHPDSDGRQGGAQLPFEVRVLYLSNNTMIFEKKISNMLVKMS